MIFAQKRLSYATKILTRYRDLNPGYFQKERELLSNLTATCIETYVLRRKVELSVMAFVQQ
jgi:hypothetical protein